MSKGEQERRYAGPTPHERVTEALVTLEQGIDAILTSEGFAAYLRTMARFHHYSSANIALIYAQHPEATQVAGYRTWKDLGRQVRKGEHGIKILVPHKQKIVDEETEEESVLVRSFGVGTIFDISQTVGDPLPEPPSVQVIDGASDLGMRLYSDLLDYADLRGVTATREHLTSSNGYFDPFRRHIGIGYHINGDQATKTLAHETAHMVANHTIFDRKADVETVAESAAYVVLNHYGIDSSGYSFPYVAGWAHDRTILRQNLDAIQQVSHEIIGTLEGTQEHVIYERPRP